MCSQLRNVPAVNIQAAETLSCQLQQKTKPLAKHRNLHLPICWLQSLLQPLGAVCNCCPIYAADSGHVMFQSGPASQGMVCRSEHLYNITASSGMNRAQTHHNDLAKEVDQCTAQQRLGADNTGLTGTKHKPGSQS